MDPTNYAHVAPYIRPRPQPQPRHPEAEALHLSLGPSFDVRGGGWVSRSDGTASRVVYNPDGPGFILEHGIVSHVTPMVWPA